MTPRALRTALLRSRRRPALRSGTSPLALRGDGYEFAELRAYVPGDDPRRIDWAATARTTQLQTRVVLEDVGLVFAAVVDGTASMRVGRRTTLFDAAGGAAQAWFAAAEQEDRCVAVSRNGIVPREAVRGTRAARAAAAAAPEDRSLIEALRVALAALPRGSALLVASDFFDDVHDDLLRECARRFDCTALLASDPWSQGLPLCGLRRFRDAETGRVARVYLGHRHAERYAQAVRRRERSLREHLERLGWRAGALVEGEGPASLYGAFGLA